MRLTEGASHLWATIRSRKISVTFSDEATGRQKWLTRYTDFSMQLMIALILIFLLFAVPVFLLFTASVLFRVIFFKLCLHRFWSWEQVDRWGMR